MIRKLLKFIAILLAAVAGLAAVGILILTVAEYRPADTEAVTPAGSASEILRLGDTVRVVSWNIGFGALGVLIKNRLRLRREAREAKKNQPVESGDVADIENDNQKMIKAEERKESHG